jgi:hypothetical protein
MKWINGYQLVTLAINNFEYTFMGATKKVVINRAYKGLIKELEKLDKKKEEIKEVLNKLEEVGDA